MNFVLDVNTLLSGVILMLVGVGVKGLFGMKDELAKINTRIATIETWTEGHEALDEERQTNILKQFEDISERRKTQRT